MRPVPHRGLALLAIVAAIVGACDPEYALVVDNQGSEMVVVGRFLDASGRTTADVVIAPANSRTTIGSFGVGSTDHPFRIIILTPGCEVVGDLPLSEPFTEGGTFTVGRDSKVTVVPGGNPSGGANAVTTDECLSTVQGLTP
ncbi:MAG TPA: hypothetical protein VIL81_00570 [Candidatus Limnocylindrales bacterium]